MVITDFNVAVVEWDEYVTPTILRYGRLDYHDTNMQVARHYIQPGDVVCDVGACIGHYTVIFSQFVGESGFVHAFEPNPVALECLRYNTMALPNVQTYGLALGHKTQLVDLYASTNQPTNIGAMSLFEGSSLPMTTLDLVARDWQRLDFLKIDAEGSESFILDGAVQTIQRFQPYIFMEIHEQMLSVRERTPQMIYRQLDRLGYQYRPADPFLTLFHPELDIICCPKNRPWMTDDWSEIAKQYPIGSQR